MEDDQNSTPLETFATRPVYRCAFCWKASADPTKLCLPIPVNEPNLETALEEPMEN